MSYVLHGFAQSGNCYKVALYLSLAGLDWSIAPVAYESGVTRDPAWRGAVNAMGEAPVLEVGGRRLTQSGAILTYLAETTGHFAPNGEDERYEALRWILFDNHKFTGYLSVYRFLRTFALSEPDPAVLAFLKARLDNALGIVETRMAGRSFVATDDGPSIADLSMMGYLFFPADELGYDLAADYPAIHAWTERVRVLPGWKDPYEMLPSANMPRRGS